ncbi:condensation domain-containing protein [Burkholderia ubonensis]|uniref:condensation domain-containing protein n=1 Tax=Burkholderia ubonensis TaxID=101571 RepID=UPI000ACE4BD0|nr:condensation domain-containing protein [Burkholderia ubonensis]
MNTRSDSSHIDMPLNVGQSRDFSLSSAQEAIYVDQTLNPESTAYNLGGVVMLPGDLDISLLIESLRQVARKFDALRLIVQQSHDGLTQRVASEVDFQIPLFGENGERCERNSALSRAAEFVEERIDVGGASPLWGIYIARVAEAETWLVYRFHHIIIDGFSVAIVMREICKIYEKLASGSPFDVATGFTFASIPEREVRYLGSNRYDFDREFWRSRVDADVLHENRAGHGPVTRHEVTGKIDVRIPRGEYDAVDVVLGRNHISITSFFVACLAVVSCRVRQVESIAIGVSNHNRSSAAERACGVGMISMVLPVSVKLGDDSAIERLCKNVAEDLRSVYRHRNFQFSRLKSGHLGLSRASRLYDVLFSHERFHDGNDITIEGKRVKVRKFESRYERTPLAVYVRDYHSDEDVRITIHFRSELS